MYDYICLQCRESFSSYDKNRKYCSKLCYDKSLEMTSFNDESIRKMYWGNEKSINQIADYFGVDQVTIYKRMVKYGIPRRGISSAVKIARFNETKCSVQNCELEYYSLGYCRKHYERFYKWGDPLFTKNIHGKRMGLKCNVVGCDNEYYAKELCKTHYMKQRHFNRITVLNRDSYTCQKCGFVGVSKELCIHHKIPFHISKDNSLNNLITRCSPCHMEDHGWRI